MGKRLTTHHKNPASLSQAQHLAQSGRLQDAERITREVLKKQPNNADALSLHSMLLAQQGNLDQSELLIRKAISLSSGNPSYHCNLALVLSRKNQHKDAIEEYQRALSFDTNLPQAHYNMGILLRDEKNYERAIEAFQNALRLSPSFAPAYNSLGNTFRDKGNVDEAISSYRKAISLKPDLVNARAQLGFLLYEQNLLEEAEIHLALAARLQPDYPRLLFALGSVLFDQSKLDHAIGFLTRATELNPKDADALAKLGSVFRAKGSFREAANALQQSLAIRPDCTDTLFALGLTMQDLLNFPAAVDYLRRALELRPDFTMARLCLGSISTLQGDLPQALQCCDAVLRDEPDNIDAVCLRARLHSYSGEAEKAYSLIEPLLSKHADNTNLALAFASICKKLKQQEKAIGLLENLLNSGIRYPYSAKRNIYFTLGKLHDEVGNYDAAFSYYQHGNSLSNDPFDIRQYQHFIDELIDIHNPQYMDSRPCSSMTTDRPIFIIGMPRSGTTLVEQVLASHSRVHGGGELLVISHMTQTLPDIVGSTTPYPGCLSKLSEATLDQLASSYMEKLSQLSSDAARVTDKLPGNFLNLGFIEQLFPNARVIHCTRDPIDTCLSCYFQDFSGSQPYANDLENLGHYYQGYRKLMRHWLKVLKIPVLEVRYRDMVTDFERESQRLVEFCGLEWEDSCKEFHQTNRFVITASSDQVSQPIYTKSIDRWKNYKRHLGPLLNILGTADD